MNAEWLSNNANQQEAIDLLKKLEGQLPEVPTEMVDGFASENVDELNKFLKEHGYSIKLRPLNQGDVGVVTSTELEGKWHGSELGKVKFASGNTYPVFVLKNVQFFDVDAHDAPVIQVYNDPKTNITAYATPPEGELPGLDAPSRAAQLTPRGKPGEQNGNRCLPMVDKNVSQNIDF
jgi:hypothetical protein